MCRTEVILFLQKGLLFIILMATLPHWTALARHRCHSLNTQNGGGAPTIFLRQSNKKKMARCQQEGLARVLAVGKGTPCCSLSPPVNGQIALYAGGAGVTQGGQVGAIQIVPMALPLTSYWYRFHWFFLGPLQRREVKNPFTTSYPFLPIHFVAFGNVLSSFSHFST